MKAKLFTFLFFFSLFAHSYTDKTFYTGLALFSENSINKITKSDTGTNSLLGTSNYPLLLKYDVKSYENYFISPSLSYSVVSRSSSGGSAKATLWHLYFPIGANFSASEWDWSFGPGILNRTIQGSGGTQQLSNGTGVATFSLPGGKSTAQNYTLNFGGSYVYKKSRFGLDLITEELFSSTKKNYNLMLSYSYAIYGGAQGSRSRSKR